MIRLFAVLIFTTPILSFAMTGAEAFSCAELMLANTGKELKFELPMTVEELKKADEIEKVREVEMLNAVAEEPAQIFLETRDRMRQARVNGSDFSYTIFEPVLKRMMIDLAIRMHEKVDEDELRGLRFLIAEGHELLAKGVPYKATMRFSFKYLYALDHFFLKLHPKLTGKFHRTNAEHMLEKILEKAPDIVMYPSFKPVGTMFFAKTRGVPFHIVGLHPEGCRPGESVPFADGYEMMPSEFAWHDIGHIEFMMMRDFQYLQGAGLGKPLEVVIEQWDLTRRHIVGFWNSFKSDKDMHDAIGLILFEILHERGYQYSYSLLKNQLDTPKWVEILLRKLNNGYYSRFPKMNMKQFDVLEPARLALLKYVDESRRAWQKRYAEAIDAKDLTVKVTHYPKIDYTRGHLERIEIHRNGETTVFTKSDDGVQHSPPIDNLTLAQVSPSKTSTLTPEVVAKINNLLALNRSVVMPDDHRYIDVKSIIITPDKKIFVKGIVEASGKTVELPLSEVPDVPVAHHEQVLDRHVFQLNQVLGNEERKKPLSFTLYKPVNTVFGRLRFGMFRGEEMVTVLGRGDKELGHFPLSEILIDKPLSFDFKQE
jgi:hypothetical protein